MDLSALNGQLQIFKKICSTVTEPNITTAQSLDFKCDYPDNQEDDVG